MAAWVNCAFPSPAFFGGFAADMGEYVGAWPLMPTGVIEGLDPANTDEIDFVVGLPNPAHPDDPYFALDDSYDSPIWGAFRFADSFDPTGSLAGWFTGSSGGAAPPDGLTPPPPGCHIWVVGYVGTPLAAPVKAPEFYVPHTYAATGAATLQTLPGGWSDWQPSSRHALSGVRFDGPGAGGSNWQLTGSGGPVPESVPNPHGDILALAQAATAIAVTDSVSGPGTDGGGVITVGASRFNPGFIDPGRTGAMVSAEQQVAGYLAAPVNPFPLGSLIFDVDYGQQPWTELEYEYDGDPSDVIWGSLLGTYDVSALSAIGTGLAVSLTTGIRLQLLAAPDFGGTPGLIAGELLAEFPIASAAPTAGDVPYVVAIPSSVGLQLTVSAAAAFLYDGATSDQYPDIAADGSYSWDAAHTFGTTDYSWLSPRWRYWKANPIVPAPPAVPPYLRMTQRNDGLGIAGHPRLPAEQGSTSFQSAQAPRVGDTNTYS